MNSFFSRYLKEIVFGGNDGIVTTFAVVAGFSGATLNENSLVQLSFLSVLLFGVANLFADGSSMGLGNYLSEKSAVENYKSLKQEQIVLIKDHSVVLEKETAKLLLENGIKGDHAKTVLLMFRKHKAFWVDFLMNYKLKERSVENINPKVSGITTSLSFITFGFIPLIPFIVFPTNPNNFIFSIIGTVIALVLLGSFRAIIVKKDRLKSIMEVLLIGSIASLGAFIIGTIFSKI